MRSIGNGPCFDLVEVVRVEADRVFITRGAASPECEMPPSNLFKLDDLEGILRVFYDALTDILGRKKAVCDLVRSLERMKVDPRFKEQAKIKTPNLFNLFEVWSKYE